MKKSFFNIFTKWQHIYCGVNLFSGIKIILLQQDYDCFLNNPQQLDKDLYATLVAGGFIIEDGLDEYAMIIHRRNNAVFYNKQLRRKQERAERSESTVKVVVTLCFWL